MSNCGWISNCTGCPAELVCIEPILEIPIWLNILLILILIPIIYYLWKTYKECDKE